MIETANSLNEFTQSFKDSMHNEQTPKAVDDGEAARTMVTMPDLIKGLVKAWHIEPGR